MQKYYLSIIERTILKRFGQEKKKRKLSPKILDFKDGKYKADGEPFSSTVVPVSGQLPILEFLPVNIDMTLRSFSHIPLRSHNKI